MCYVCGVVLFAYICHKHNNMKRLFFSRLSSMFLAITLLFASSLQAQTYPPWSTSTEFYSQLFNSGTNASGAYYLGNSPVSSFVSGSQSDTSCSGCKFSPLSLVLGTFRYQKAPAQDTITPIRISGTGAISVSVRAYLATVVTTTSAVVHSTLYQSNTGYSWDWQPVSGVAVMTLTATSTSTPVTGSWEGVTKTGLFYMVQSSVTGDTAALYSDLYYAKTQTVQVTTGR